MPLVQGYFNNMMQYQSVRKSVCSAKLECRTGWSSLMKPLVQYGRSTTHTRYRKRKLVPKFPFLISVRQSARQVTMTPW